MRRRQMKVSWAYLPNESFTWCRKGNVTPRVEGRQGA